MAGPCDASPLWHDTGVEAHGRPRPPSSTVVEVGTVAYIDKHGGPPSLIAVGSYLGLSGSDLGSEFLLFSKVDF
jgi:hypothetical protein